jgi:hypothetical protein
MVSLDVGMILSASISMVFWEFRPCFIPSLEKLGFSGKPFKPLGSANYTKTKSHSGAVESRI